MQVTRDDVRFMKNAQAQGLEPNEVVGDKERMGRILHDLEKGHEFQDALEKITRMGRVCPEYDRCTHEVCDDSALAALTAINVLKEETDETQTQEMERAHREVSLLASVVLDAFVNKDLSKLERLITRDTQGSPVVTLREAQ